MGNRGAGEPPHRRLAPLIGIGSATRSRITEDFYASGALPPRGGGNVMLTLDDGSADTSIGFDDGGEFIWFNRFTPDPTDYPFILTEIQLLTPGIGNCEVNEKVDFYLYQDPHSNPLNGATFVASLRNQTVGPFFTYTSYPIAVPFTEPGDVLILVVNHTCNGVFQYPAGLDAGSPSQQRSWLGYYDGTVADPPVLPAPQFFGLVDAIGFAGNWTLRGVGISPETCTAPADIPWLTLSPARGTTTDGTSSDLTVTYDSTGLADGVYTGTLCLVSNDPDERAIRLPVTLTVTRPTAIDLATFRSGSSAIPVADVAVVGLLLLAGAAVVLRRR